MYTFGTILLMVQYEWAASIFTVNVKYFSPLPRTKGTPNFVLLGFWFIHTYVIQQPMTGDKANTARLQHLLQSL